MTGRDAHYTTSELKRFIDNQPYPVAKTLTKYLKLSYDQISEKHSVLCDLFESFVKIHSIIGLCSLMQSQPSFKTIFPSGISFLKHPSLGHWVSILRSIAAGKIEMPAVCNSIKDFFYRPIMTKEISDAYNSLPEINFHKSSSVVDSIISSLVTYRNKVWKGHGAVLTDETSLDKRVSALESLVFFLFDNTALFEKNSLLYVREVKLPSKELYEVSAVSLIGVNNEMMKYRSDKPMYAEDVYLFSDIEGDSVRTALSLSPFVKWGKTADNSYKFFFFNDAQRAKLEYLSYYDGSFYYHRELSRDIEKLLDVSLERNSEETDFIRYNYSQEERITRSNSYYIQGKQKASEGKIEDALLLYEQGIEWYRSTDLMYERILMLYELGEDSDYLVALVETALENSPDDSRLLKLKDTFGSVSPAKPIPEYSPDYSNYDSYKDQIFLLFELLVPKKFRHFGSQFVLAFVLLINITTTGLLYLYAPQYAFSYLLAPISLTVLESIILLILPILRKYYTMSYYKLFSQVSNMKQDRYNDWFLNRIFAMYGYIKIRADGKLVIDWYREKPYMIGIAAFIISWSIAMIMMQTLYALPLYIAVIQFIQVFIFWSIVSVILRALLFSSVLISSFSNLTLNPLISESNKQGFEVLMNGFFQFLSLFMVFWFFFWLYFSVVCADPLYTDIGGVLIAWLLVFGWTILTPRNLSIAAKSAQSNALLKYQTHIIDSFNDFIKNPDDVKKEKLQWMVKSEVEIRNLMRGLFRFKHILFIIVVNIWVIMGGLLYASYRINNFTVFIDFISNLLNSFSG